MTEIVDKYRLEGDTTDAQKAVKDFDNTADKSFRKVEGAVKGFEKAVKRANKEQAASFAEAQIKVELLKKAFEIAFRALGEWADLAMDEEKGLPAQERTVTNLKGAWDKLNTSIAVTVAKGPAMKSFLTSTGTAFDNIAEVISRTGSVFEGLIALGDIAFRGGEATRRFLDKTGGASGWGPAGEPEKPAPEAEGGGGPGGKSRKPTEPITFGSDLGEGYFDVAAAQEDAALKRTIERLKDEQDVLEQQTQRRIDLKIQEIEYLDKLEQDHQEAQLEAIEQYADTAKAYAAAVAGALTALFDDGAEGLFSYLEQFARSKGQELLIDGAVTTAKGIAMLATQNPLGAAAISAGAQEIALGGALLAGGYLAGAAAGSMSGGGGGGGSSGAYSGGGYGAGAAPAMPQYSRTPENVNVSVYTFGKMDQEAVSKITRELNSGLKRGYR